jgi:hypothetical protein
MAMTFFAARVTPAQDTTQTSSAGDKQCIQRTRGNPSDTGAANRADPTLQGNKDCAPPSVRQDTISGVVFFDVDLNGMLGSDEVGLSSWTVQLTGPVSQTASTDMNGAYSFIGLSAGRYTVCVMMLPGWSQTGPANGATCPIGTGYSVVVSPLDPITWHTGKDFGFVSQ